MVKIGDIVLIKNVSMGTPRKYINCIGIVNVLGNATVGVLIFDIELCTHLIWFLRETDLQLIE